MDNPIIWYKRSREKRQAIRFANDLAFHMHSVYSYLLYQNRSFKSGSCVREAMELLENWKRVSENLYEHKPTGLALEVRPDSKLLPMTKAVLDIEVEGMLSHCTPSEKANTLEKTRCIIDEYFAKNSIIDRSGI